MRTLTRQRESQVGSVSVMPGTCAYRSKIRWKPSSDGGNGSPLASSSGPAWNWKKFVPGIGQSITPRPSDANH